jgi:glycosyltransferase involved in cell wall biosynthesis
MSNNPLISIVIPSYNKVKYIQKTLDSIVNQNYKNIEVIIQDGGSTDGTLEVIKRFANKYPKQIKLESKKDGGQLNAINMGLKKAKGDIVTYINADDIYENGAFESVVGYYLENPNALWFAGKSIVINDNDAEIAKFATIYKNFLLKLNSRTNLLIVNYLMQPSVFLTKTAIKKYGQFTGTKNFVMEYDMWLKIGKNQMPVVINKVLSKFRLEKDTKTSTMFDILLKEDEKIIKKYTNNPLVIFAHKVNNLTRILIKQKI